MGFVTKNQNTNLGKELNDMIASLGYEIVLEPEKEENDDKKVGEKDDMEDE